MNDQTVIAYHNVTELMARYPQDVRTGLLEKHAGILRTFLADTSAVRLPDVDVSALMLIALADADELANRP